MKKLLLTLSLLVIGAFGLFAASCGATTYSLSFDTDGGAEISAVEVQEGEEYTLPVPTREGYSFEGWYLTADFSGDPVTTITATGDTTLYAKWEQLSVITLDLNGGTLAEGATLYLKSGEVVYDFMQAYIPTKSGFIFGAWFDGDEELARNTRMPEGGITLTAEYKVGYSVEVYTQKLTQDGYELSDTLTGGEYYDYVGTTVAPEVTLTGFRAAQNDDAVTSFVLTENAAGNILKLYFDRESYNVTFNPNYPADAQAGSGESVTVSVVYGASVELPIDFTCGGYILTGWSASIDGEADYTLDYIDSVIYNKEDGAVYDPVEFSPTRNTALYAVWTSGYADMYGGNDYIFHLNEEDASVYLQRGSVYFRGDYLSNSQFSFRITDDELLEGRLNEDGTFVYFNDSRVYVAHLYVPGEGLDNKTAINFDGLNGLTYIVYDDDDTAVSSSRGIYSIDESGQYVVTFSEGDFAGQTLYMIVGTADGSPAFQLRNEDEVALGALPRFAVGDADGNGSVEIVSYRDNIYDLTLNGFGTASMNVGSSQTAYRYVMSEDGTQISLLSALGTTVGTARIVELNGSRGYMLYDSSYDATYTAEDGSTLVLDGMYRATYTRNGVPEEGYFSLYSNSAFGGVILSYTSLGGVNRVFIVDSESTGTGSDTVTTYSFSEKPIGYAEYQYQNNQTIYYAPLIVLNDFEEGKASVYGYNAETSTYAVVLTGSWSYDEESELYTFIAEGEPVDADVSTSQIDLSKVKQIVFAVTVTTTDDASYQVNYWYSALIESEDGSADINEEYAEVYTCQNVEGGRLTLVADFAILEENGNRYFGTYSTVSGDNENLIAIAVLQNGSVAGYLYVELDPDGGTYYSMDTAPYTAQAVLSDGSFSSTETLAFNGKGGAVYTLGEQQYTGTVTQSSTTAMGYLVYTFTSDTEDMTFTFLQLSGNSRYYFIKYNTEMGAGEYYSEEAGRLVLDGYANAQYTDVDGNSYQGMYFLVSDEWAENVLVLSTETGATFYFDYTDFAAGEFTVRGWEYGIFLYMDNQAVEGVYIRLDGYEGAALYTVSTGEEGETVYNYIDRNASYTLNEDGTVSVMYKESSESAVTTTVTGTLGVVTVSSTQSIPVFVKLYEEFVSTFVNTEDWSVLILDGYGNVTRYDAEGNAENGLYTVIKDGLLYYANAEGSDASLYSYNIAEGSMSPISLTAHAYYTSDLESLLFTEYGFAIFNGETRYYYTVDSGRVTIYLQDPSSPDANEYGFIEDSESIPFFTSQITYEDKTYYENNGFSLSFRRAEEDAGRFPVSVEGSDGEVTHQPLGDLYFQPSGASEFNVSGRLYVGDVQYNCSVVREEVADGEYEMYILLPTSSYSPYYFRFDISVNYSGSAAGGDEEGRSTYTISAMQNFCTLPSDTYLTMYYLIYYMYGANTANTFTNAFGEISMITEFDEAGDAGEPYVNAWFGEAGGIYDTQGNLFTIEKAPYQSEGNSQYSASFTGADGYDYELHFVVAYNNYVGTYGFRLSGIVRVQELTDEATGMKVKVGRVVGSDSYAPGSVFSLELTDAAGQVLTYDIIGYIGEDLYYIVREREETEGDEPGRITSSTYYKLVFTDKTGETVGDIPAEDIVPAYGTVTVTSETVSTYYTADGSFYVDIDANNNVRIIFSESTNRGIAFTECEYDEGTKTYTATSAAGVRYTVQMQDNGTVVIEEVPAEEVTDDTETGEAA